MKEFDKVTLKKNQQESNGKVIRRTGYNTVSQRSCKKKQLSCVHLLAAKYEPLTGVFILKGISSTHEFLA